MVEYKSYRHLGAIGVTIFICIIIFIATRNILLCIGIGFGILFFYASGEAFIDYCKRRTTLFFTNIGIKGNNSIIESDMFTLKSPYENDLEYKVSVTGGSSVPYLPFHGFGPVYICPSEYVKPFHGGMLAIADWYKVDFDMLPKSFQKALQDRVTHFNKSMGFYWADTTKFNEAMRSKLNIDLAERSKKQEKLINELDTQNQQLMSTINSLTNTLKETRLVPEDHYNRRPREYRPPPYPER